MKKILFLLISLLFLPWRGETGCNLDREWGKAIREIKGETAEEFFRRVNLLGEGKIQLPLLFLLSRLPGEYERESARLGFQAWLRVSFITVFLKWFTGRERPPKDRFHGASFKYDSFPSGHTSTSFALAEVFGERYKKKTLAFLLAGGVGVARVYLKKHHPTDVIFGAFLGWLVGKSVLKKNPQPQTYLLPSGFMVSFGFK